MGSGMKNLNTHWFYLYSKLESTCSRGWMRTMQVSCF